MDPSKMVKKRDHHLLTYVIVTYNQCQNYNLQSCVCSLLASSNDSWEAIIIHDGPSKDGTKQFMEGIVASHPNKFRYYESEERGNCWGHQNRAWGLSMVETPWVLMTNADNQHGQKLLQELEGDMVSGEWDVLTFKCAHSYFACEPFFVSFDFSQCDMAQFITRTELAKKAGFNDRSFAADGIFIEDLKKANPGLRVGHRKGLFVFHN